MPVGVDDASSVLKRKCGNGDCCSSKSCKMENGCCDGMTCDATAEETDKYYFASYADLQCHQTMVFDMPRTNAYRKAIFAAVAGKTVLEVGCGTGILSVFAAQAGAKHVYAVEASKPMAGVAQRIIGANGLPDKITILADKVENVKEQDINNSCKVDVLISEWMGYGLFTEWMLNSVIDARDRFLAEDGVMLPSTARLYVAPVSETTWLKNQSDYWLDAQKLFKVDMSALKDDERRSVLGRIGIHEVPPWEIIAKACKVMELDLRTTPADYHERLTGDFEFRMYGSDMCYGFAIWFDMDLTKEVRLTTSPFAKEQTHWTQMVVYFKGPVKVEQDTLIKGSMKIRRHANRNMGVDVNCAIGDVLVKDSFDEYVENN